jgi:hypothetical protein
MRKDGNKHSDTQAKEKGKQGSLSYLDNNEND